MTPTVLLLAFAVAAHAPTSWAPHISQMVGAFFTMITVIAVAWIQTRDLKRSHRPHEEAAEAARNAAIETRDDVREIKKAVNGNGKATG